MRLIDWHDVQVGPLSLMVSFASTASATVVKSMVMFQNVLITSVVCDEHKQGQSNSLRRHSFKVKRKSL